MAELHVKDLFVTYGSGTHSVFALRGVSFSVGHGETVAIVGESGCGKSTTAAVVAGLTTPTAGTIDLDGARVSVGPRTKTHRQTVQMVFQHPDQSLDRRWSVQKSIEEPLRRLTRLSAVERTARSMDVIQQVGLDESFLSRSPRSLSGGQAQRVAIGRALAPEPSLVVLDEPTASLDQSVRAQILRLLKRLQRENGLSYLLITHDLSSVRKIADRVVVMYLGKVVESGPVGEVVDDPQHPYTRALLQSVPGTDPRNPNPLTPLGGETPSATSQLPGCAFVGRCEWAIKLCHAKSPVLMPIGTDREAACHRIGEI